MESKKLRLVFEITSTHPQLSSLDFKNIPYFKMYSDSALKKYISVSELNDFSVSQKHSFIHYNSTEMKLVCYFVS